MRISIASMISLQSSVKNSSYATTFPSFNPLASSSWRGISNFSYLKLKGSFTGISISTGKRSLCVVSGSTTDDGFQQSSFKGSETFFRTVLANMETFYLNRNPTAKAILELVASHYDDRIFYDHVAFRTFGVNGYGIDSMAKIFLDFGYTPRDELSFPAKKLKALWFSPPSICSPDIGTGIYGPLPRVFISELLVDQMSLQAQEIIRRYTENAGNGYQHAALASAVGSLAWKIPLYSDFQELARESEYAAWTLVNGYALNHVTLSTHRLKTYLRYIRCLNNFVEKKGFRLNTEGGVLKVSPDGLLLQSSTVADSISFHFAEGVTMSVPGSYIEFAERLVLPEYQDLPENELKECHRRDGFEVGNADKIFESTSRDQLTMEAA